MLIRNPPVGTGGSVLRVDRLACQIVVGAVFAYAGALKIMSGIPPIDLMLDYLWIPRSAHVGLIWSVSVAELTLAVMLLGGIAERVGALLGLGVLCVFSIALLVAAWRSDFGAVCTCLSDLYPTTLALAIVRNCVLMALCTWCIRRG